MTPTESPWVTPTEASKYARCGVKIVYAAIRRGALRAARLNDRGDYRIHQQWLDEWLTALAEQR